MTLDGLLDELDEARVKALVNNQTSAAVQATMGKAKLTGHIIDKKQFSGPGGGPIPVYDLSKATNEQLDTLEAIFGPLASAVADDEGDPGGESEEGGRDGA